MSINDKLVSAGFRMPGHPLERETAQRFTWNDLRRAYIMGVVDTHGELKKIMDNYWSSSNQDYLAGTEELSREAGK